MCVQSKPKAPSSRPSESSSSQPSVIPSCVPTTQPSQQPTTTPTLSSNTISILKTDNLALIVTNSYSFAVINSTHHHVITWGSVTSGGDSSSVSDLLVNVKLIFATKNAFAALRYDGTVISWGLHTEIRGSSIYHSNINVTS
jgi:hypothetical protein